MAHRLFRSALFSFYKFVDFLAFLLLMSIFLLLWSEKIVGLISVLNLLRFMACHMIYLEMFRVHLGLCILLWDKILEMSVQSICSRVWFSSNVSLLIFCLDDLSMADSGVLKTPAVIILSVSPLDVSICLIYFGAPTLGAYIFTIVISSS